MMKLTTASVLFLGLLFDRRVAEAQPPNDACENAVIIPATPTFPFNHTTLDFQNATEGADDPVLACWYFPTENATIFPTSAPINDTIPPYVITKGSIWYSWTPATDGSFDFIALGGSESFGYFSSTIAVFQGTSCAALEEVACSYSFATAEVTAGTTYFAIIEMDFYEGDPFFDAFVANMTLTVHPTPPPPSNDECVNATVIPSDAALPYSTAPVAFAQATENPSDPILTCNYYGGGVDNSTDGGNSTVTPSTIAPSYTNSDGKTVWYEWTPAESGSYDFSATGVDLYGYEPYAVFGIFEGDACGDAEEIQCQNGGGYLRRVPLTGGTTYRIKVGVFSDYGTLILTVAPTPPPPSNDECVDATVIPSAPTFPYSTEPVELISATENPNDPLLTCSYFYGGVDNSTLTNSTLAPSTIAPSYIPSDGSKTVWYIWTPAESGSYDFSASGSDSYGSEIYATIGIFDGDACDDLEELKCTANGGRLRGNALVGGTTYRIKVGTWVEDGRLILTVKPTPPPPANDACVGAIPIDPQSGKVVVNGDITDAILESVLENTCSTLDETSGLWYKIDNTNGDVLGIVASTCDEATTFDTRISVFKGDDCSVSLECVGSVDDSYGLDCGVSSRISFLANETTTYWVLVHGFGSSYGNFTLTVESFTSFFTLIDAEKDSVIELLGDSVNYGYNIPTPNLNIQATFSNDLPVESVRITFDNPKRSFCKGAAPFSVFGDSNGNYFGKSLPVGTHLVTASAFTEANCQGSTSTVLRQTFEVTGCSMSFNVYDSTNSSFYYFLEPGYENEIPNLPCDMNMEASLYCGFEVDGVRLELRDTETNTVVTARTDMVPPFFLFGVDSNGDIATGSIAQGAYSLTAWIDGIQHPSLNFTVIDACF